ncbi:hypothetical protein BHE90_012736 [Fusarium euwallaceae]|uniref:Zn(2)-C6 fungal-type domain-containing protein n=2 Tax=Fusarium solani species complex TaxID=232080 RepID=A0A430LAS1_9HYPO|nr:hypothetical protein CDV31_014627 [Fusarium ambrosium]RTE72848.1 hypothetical protein BHE90_012736 [Fusarium euwallaceae]
MVYCGKPSGGCSNCRLRKIRCDQKEPSCGQCEKRNQACPGYRNLVDLMFRDESSHVINKAAKTRSRPVTGKKTQPTAQSQTSISPTPQSSTGQGSSSAKSLSKPSPVFVSESGSLPGPTSAPASKAPAKRSRKSTIRCRAPVLSALTNNPSPSASESSTDSLDDGNDLSSDQALLGDALSSELQEQGTAFFFSRYVTTDYGWSQNYAFIYDVWKPPDSDQARVDPVTVGMTAVGLVGLSQVTGCSETRTRAQQSYAIALKLTHDALRDPVEAVKDTTMLAVLVLGTYEFISGYSPHTMRAWQDHVSGAAALARMRGPGQFRTKAGVRMFLMLCHTVLISCIQSGLPMPQTLIDLRREIPAEHQSGGPAWLVAEPIYRALQVRYDIKTGKLAILDEIVEALSSADERLASIFSELPESWKYHHVQMTQPDARVLGETCHVYPGLIESTTWNVARGIRILLAETMIEQLCLAVGEGDLYTLSDCHRRSLAKSITLLDMLGRAIIASVPQHLGVVSIRDVQNFGGEGHAVAVPAKKQICRAPSPPLTHEARARSRSEPTTRTTGCLPLFDPTRSKAQNDKAERFMSLAGANHTIIWPLYVVGMSSACTPETRQYAIERLQVIHKETALEQARVVAGLLQGKVAPPTLSTELLDELPAVEMGTLPTMV